MDLHDQLYDGRKIRILTVLNAFTRYVPAIEVRERFTGADVVAALDEVCRKIGYPKSIRVDQGPEFVSKDLDCGPMHAASNSIFRGPASRRTTPLSRA